MARKSKSKRISGESKDNERLTLEAIDAISSEDDEDEEYAKEQVGQEEWNAEALALRQAIADGAFDKLLHNKKQKVGSDLEAPTEEGEELEEVSLDSDDDDSDNDSEDNSDGTDACDKDKTKKGVASDKEEVKTDVDSNDGKAISLVLEKLLSTKKAFPWVETFCVVAKNKLPFGVNDANGSSLDIHDDLKRESTFYSMALNAVNDARKNCTEAGIPFSRPEDFFAEMVKSDDHMAKVKDRLIFETKKIDAVAQRKSNKEQKLRAKEKQSNKIAEKAKRKKEHFEAIDEWKSSSQNHDALFEDNAMKPNKKRMAADKKYGFGGKRGRFKQNDPKSLNDMSSYNPRGNFAGSGSKARTSGSSKRKGKRARDASRSRN